MEEQKTIPVIEEELVTERQPVKTGSVRVQKHVEERIERIEEDLLRDATEVRHVAVGKAVSEMPRIRQEGDVVIVPVVEEEVIVTKRLILKEELHITRRRTVERVVKEVPVIRERAVVERLDAEGRVIDLKAVSDSPKRAPSHDLRPKRRRSLLE